ncbi:MAG TPA: hypothetical protein V6D11_18815 [Waterburya sp.]|jgi:hypothetical protein
MHKTYALTPLTPQAWGEQNLTPPNLGGRGGYWADESVSPDADLVERLST